MLEKGGQFSDEEEVDGDEALGEPSSKTYVQEQQRLKEEIKKAMGKEDDDDDDGGDLFKVTLHINNCSCEAWNFMANVYSLD